VAIVESKLKDGKLTLGSATGTDYGCQITNVRINSSYSTDGDAVETLCGDHMPAGEKLDGRALAGTAIQDFDNPDGLINFLWDNDLQQVEFSYVPNDPAAGYTLSGIVRVRVPDESFGGDVNARVTSDFEWAVIGDVVRTPGTPPPLQRASEGGA
jgi:hypothetical protein